MISRIRQLLTVQPFVPFTINMADGRHVRVPTRDHIALGRTGVVVFDDNDNFEVLSGLLMTDIEANIAALSEERPA